MRDIRDFDGTKWRGRWLLTAGVPCQPSSRAGKRRGADDDRWLWPQALRVLEEANPTWCIFENPPGIDDVGLGGILVEMERLGYEVQPFDIPACAINSPQLRHRYYIVGHAKGEPGTVLQREGRGGVRDSGRPVGQGNLANAQCADGQSRQEREPSRSPGAQQELVGLPADPWSNYVWVPCADGKVRRAPDDSFMLVDGLHRSLLQALGNSIVPQVAAQIIKAMIQAEQ